MSAESNWNVEEVRVGDELVLKAVNRLLPQLSSRAEPLSLAGFRELVESEASHLLIAKDAIGEIGAMLTLVIFPIPTGRRAWIEDVVVDESRRGLGLGRLITEEAIRLARTQGVATIDLTSRSSRKAAHALYESVGFVVRDTNVYRFE